MIAYIRFSRQIRYIKAVLTHDEYDKEAWEQFRSATDIAPVRDETHYSHMCTLLEALLDEVGGDKGHPLMGLADIVGDLVADYEAQYHSLPGASGTEALKFLMTQHGLKQ